MPANNIIWNSESKFTFPNYAAVCSLICLLKWPIKSLTALHGNKEVLDEIVFKSEKLDIESLSHNLRHLILIFFYLFLTPILLNL